MTQNELFSTAVYWIFDNYPSIPDQKALAAFTGITETTISRIIHNKVKRPSDATIVSFTNAFPNVFNSQWFRGLSPVMLQRDVILANTSAQAINASFSSATESTPSWALSLIDLVAQNTQSIENLLRDNLSLRSQLSQLTEEVRRLRTAISTLQYEPSLPRAMMAAENKEL